MEKVAIITGAELKKLTNQELLKEYKKLADGYKAVLVVPEEKEGQLAELNKLKASLESQVSDLNSQLSEKFGKITQLEEDLETAQKIIAEQNETIEETDKVQGTETGNFFTHQGKKIECRIPTFKVHGSKYSLEDLKANKEITILVKSKAKKVGLTDYLLSKKSPILEIEE